MAGYNTLPKEEQKNMMKTSCVNQWGVCA
ncbi:hypothetical protein B5F18_05235 [Lachnoclostridium sp. An181]|nr:hypothetical protein B5F18_05235 [Lachnoclostridium sp. An181]